MEKISFKQVGNFLAKCDDVQLRYHAPESHL